MVDGKGNILPHDLESWLSKLIFTPNESNDSLMFGIMQNHRQ